LFCGKQICRKRAGHCLHVRQGGLQECALGLEPVAGDVVDERGDFAGDVREGDASVAHDLAEHEVQRLDRSPRLNCGIGLTWWHSDHRGGGLRWLT
jgi:hypothetical protein